MRDFRSELPRVAKMTKSSLDLLPSHRHPDMFLTEIIPFAKTRVGKFHTLNGFSFSLSFLLAYYGIEKKGVVYFFDGFSEFWRIEGFSMKRTPLLLLCMYGFNDNFRQEDFIREYPDIILNYMKYKDPFYAFQRKVYEFNSLVFSELSDHTHGYFRPTGVFGLDYSFTVEYGKEQASSIGRLSLTHRREMIWT